MSSKVFSTRSTQLNAGPTCQSSQNKAPSLGLILGAKRIGAVLDLSPRQVRHLHEHRALPTWKIAGSIATTTEALQRWIADQSASDNR